MEPRKRQLTADEWRILQLLQDNYGPQNNLDAVFFSAGDEAAIFVKDINGVPGILANLTVIPTMQKMEGVAHDEVFERYLRPPGTQTVPKDQA